VAADAAVKAAEVDFGAKVVAAVVSVVKAAVKAVKVVKVVVAEVVAKVAVVAVVAVAVNVQRMTPKLGCQSQNSADWSTMAK